MQELNRAYQDGDVARLLEIERAAGRAGGREADIEGGGGDGLEEELVRLRRGVELLRAQYQALLARLRDGRRDPVGGLVAEFRRLRRAGVADPLDEAIAPLAQGLEDLRRVHAFVAAFHEGRMSFHELVQGPPPTPTPRTPPDEIAGEFLAMLALVAEKAAATDAPLRRRRRGRKRRRRRH